MARSLTHYADIATQYAEDVVAGKVMACRYVIECCQRHLDDIVNEDLKYYWNPTIVDEWGKEYRPAERICKFIELLPHVKGKWARQKKKIKLEPWQIFIAASLFGWVDENGYRRFRVGYIEVPRKNAKTTLASAIGLFLTALDGEEGAEVYSAATTADQAKISWNIAKRMVEKSPEFQMRYGIRTFSRSIPQESSASFFKYLSSDSKTLDGLNVHGGIVDELHAHKTRDVFDVIETATGSREQALLFLITTAGSNRAGICYEQRSYTIKLLDNVVDDPTYFGIIYTIDEDDDWTDPSIWAKANPNYGVSVDPDDLLRKATKAMAMTSAQNNFLTKHLNVWVNADTLWMNMVKWDKCGVEGLDIDDYVDYECMVALDFSSKTDIASMSIMFELEKPDEKENKMGKYAWFVKNYLPEETIEESTNAFYSGWASDGNIIETKGNTTDFGRIEEDLLEVNSKFKVMQNGFDPFQATQFSQRMIDEGLEMIEVRQTVLNFSEPMKDIEALTISGNMVHAACPVLTWMISNVVCHLDTKDNIYPRKEFPENKIDGVVAGIMCLYLFLKYERPQASVYETRGVIRL